MKVFHLPDLGEGLPDAEIHQWHVKPGDQIEADDILVSMETAKAIVDVPAPFPGTIDTCFGQVGDVLNTGDPLIAYTDDSEQVKLEKTTEKTDNTQQTVQTIQTSTQTTQRTSNIQTLPGVRLLAKQLNVNLNTITGSGNHGLVTPDDVIKAANVTSQQSNQAATPPEGYEPVRGVRRAMASSMTLSHANVAPVSLVDDANISNWESGHDITLRVIRSIITACKQIPDLNAWFDDHSLSRLLHQHVNLGLAMDSDDGLFVPVLKQVDQMTPEKIREQINQFKVDVANRSIDPNLLKAPTITLSNFGVFAGRYATPVIVPPMVAIIATGRLYEQVQLIDNKPVKQRLLPLSLTVDHRACTGGETARFLKVMIEDLGKVN